MRRVRVLPRLLSIGGLVAGLLPATSAAAPAGPAQVTRSVPDDDDRDLGVVALEVEGRPYCSGTLIAPRVVLTAAHCVVDQPPIRVFAGSQPGDGGTTAGVVEVRIEPSFDRPSLRGDVATLVLDDAVDAPSWPILAAEDAAALAGGTLRLVGFGKASADDTAPLRKRMGTASVATVDATSFGFTPSPSQTCMGDSGGPAFATVGGVEYLAGVTSSGDVQCLLHATDVRADAYRDTLIAPSLHAAEDSAEAAGGCAVAGRPGPAPPAGALLLLALAARVVRSRRARNRRPHGAHRRRPARRLRRA
jgi:MYXO-CTERM domain-containing protein